MTRNLKTELTLTVMGLVLGAVPGSRSCAAQDDHPAQPHALIAVFVSVTVVHIEAEALDELRGSAAAAPSLATLPLNKLWKMARSDEGVHIVSRSSLSVLNGHEARMGFTETERHKNKSNEGHSGEFAEREMVVHFEVKPQVDRQKGIAVQFNYNREESDEATISAEGKQEEESMAEKFEISTTLLLTPGRARIAGAKQNGDIAMLLVMTAEL